MKFGTLPGFILCSALIATISSGMLSRALVSLIRRDFSTEAGIFNFFVMCDDEARKVRYFTDLIDATVEKLDFDISVRVGLQQELPGDSERHCCILAVDSVMALERIFHNIRIHHLNMGGYTLIVLQTFDGRYYDHLYGIFEEAWRTGVVNVNVVVEPIPGSILMFTYFPFSIYACASVAPIIHSRYIDSQWDTDKLFANKLSNLYGCPLVCATWPDEPYLDIIYADNGNMVLNGIEGKLLEFIASRMNFSIHLHIMNDEEIDATLDERGLIFDQLFRRGIDLVIGAFYYKPTTEDDFFKPSDSYYLSTICIVISPKREKLPPFDKLIYPFTLSVWLCVIVYFCIGLCVIGTSMHIDRSKREFILGFGNDIPVYNMCLTALGAGVNCMPRGNFARFLLCTWMLLWLVLRSGYQSALFKFIRMDISLPPPNKIDTVLKEGYRIFVTEPIQISLRNLPRIYAASEILNGSEVENFPLLPEIAEKVAILTPYEYFGFFKKRNAGRLGDFYIAKEKVFTQQLSIYLKKDSFLLSGINTNILDYSSIGLGHKWEQLFIEANSGRGKLDTLPFRVMTIDQVASAFNVYVIGNVISGVFLIFELFIHNFSTCLKIIVNKLKI